MITYLWRLYQHKHMYTRYLTDHVSLIPLILTLNYIVYNRITNILSYFGVFFVCMYVLYILAYHIYSWQFVEGFIPLLYDSILIPFSEASAGLHSR